LLLPSKGPELESAVCQDLQYGSLLESSGPRLRRQSWLGLSDWTLPPLRVRETIRRRTLRRLKTRARNSSA